MATYTSDKTATTAQPRAGTDITCVTGTYTVTANLATNDVLQMVKIPAGATVVELLYSTSASIASTTTGTIGDGADTDRYVTSSALGSGAAAFTRLNVATGHGYTYTSEDTIDIVYTTITTPVTGAVIKLTAIYTMQS